MGAHILNGGPGTTGLPAGDSSVSSTTVKVVQYSKFPVEQGSPTWCPQAPGRPQGPSKLPAGTRSPARAK